MERSRNPSHDDVRAGGVRRRPGHATSRTRLATCKVCDSGNMIPSRLYRLSGPAVTIGWILLVCSGALALCEVGFLGLVSLPAALEESRRNGVRPVAGLSWWLGEVAMFAACSAVIWFVGGLLGWLLIMQKNVLLCTRCRATVDRA